MVEFYSSPIHQYLPLPVYEVPAISVNTSISTYTFTSVYPFDCCSACCSYTYMHDPYPVPENPVPEGNVRNQRIGHLFIPNKALLVNTDWRTGGHTGYMYNTHWHFSVSDRAILVHSLVWFPPLDLPIYRIETITGHQFSSFIWLVGYLVLTISWLIIVLLIIDTKFVDKINVLKFRTLFSSWSQTKWW